MGKGFFSSCLDKELLNLCPVPLYEEKMFGSDLGTSYLMSYIVCVLQIMTDCFELNIIYGNLRINIHVRGSWTKVILNKKSLTELVMKSRLFSQMIA